MDSESKSFLPDSTFGVKFADTTREVYRVFQTNPKEFWVVSFINENELQLDKLTLDENGEYISETKPYEKIKELGTIFSIYPDPNNTDIIWFGGINGVIRYDTSIEKEINDTIPAQVRKVVFRDSMVLYGGGYLPPELAKKPIKIDYSTSSIRFEYAIPVFEDADKIEFRYTLEGFEKNWSIWTTKTEKEYGNLPEGNYTFKVQARDRYGNISPEGSMKVKILPPWYRTWWANVLYAIFIVLFIILTVYFYSQWRIKQLKAQNEELEKTVEERTQEIKAKNTQLAESLDNLQRTQQQLIMQEKMASLGQLTVGIAHEIKNPLNFVNNFAKGSTQVINDLKESFQAYISSSSEKDQQDTSELIEEITEYIGDIQQQGERADRIVSSMMNHVNDNQGQRQETDLNALVEEQSQFAYQGYKAQNSHFDAHLSKNLAVHLPQISINPNEIGRVIINLLNNAFDALNQKMLSLGKDFAPEISIQTQSLDGQIEIRIRDNGIGIPEDQQNQIFQPFYTTKDTGGGNIGLGLSISYDLITKGHQGEIKINSKENEFTEFIILLPLKS